MINDDNKEFVAQVQDAILQNPGIATGLTWTPCRWKRKIGTVIWRTNQRPDGSETRRKDKQTICIMPNGSARVVYNGSSPFPPCDLWTYLRDRYGVKTNGELFDILKNEYGITDNNRPMKTYSRKPSPRPATTKPIPTIGDESDVCMIKDDIVTKYVDLYRTDILRAWLETWLDPLVVECAWHEYRVGIARDGRTIFWYLDRQGRVRDGKIMRFTADGHRDRVAGSIVAAGSLLRDAKKLPDNWKHDGCLYGEHLLNRYPDATVGLVESEKTALVATICFPHYIWLATGGATLNLDRAVAVLNGRRVIAFPDADATDKWADRFRGLPGWSVSTIAKDFAAAANDQNWAKCDLADILALHAVQSEKVF